jgi:hypothetical protein
MHMAMGVLGPIVAVHMLVLDVVVLVAGVRVGVGHRVVAVLVGVRRLVAVFVV